MRLQFLGSGDAFGSGGRFNMCMLIDSGSTRFLLDCGASSLIAMKRLGVAPNSIETILITHFHADHFGGLPFFILDAQFSKRRAPLTIAGPPGLGLRLAEAMDVFFPRSSKIKQKFDVRILELKPGVQSSLTSFVSLRTLSALNTLPVSFLLLCRVETDGRILTYSGDADWCDELAQAAYEADLFVCEAYFYEKEIRYHINFKSLEKHLSEIRPKRLILTHMSEDMLGRSGSISCEMAEDGKLVDF